MDLYRPGHAHTARLLTAEIVLKILFLPACVNTRIVTFVRPQLRTALREFVLDDSGMPESDDYLVALGPRLRWRGDGRARTVRRAWLDTFDWRLYRAGLTLELTTGRGTGELTLTGRDGAVVAAQQAGTAGNRLKWPALLGAL